MADECEVPSTICARSGTLSKAWKPPGALPRRQDFREAVLRAVNLGDEADTTGAVCAAACRDVLGRVGTAKEW